MNARGQGWGFDLMVAIMIFLGGIILFYFFSINDSSGESQGFESIKREGNLIADSLMSEGFPLNWNENNVQRIGIVDDGRINQTKLDEFYSLVESDYLRTRSLFRVTNDYYVKFVPGVGVDGAQIEMIGLPPVNSDNMARISRVIIYDGDVITLEVIVWN